MSHQLYLEALENKLVELPKINTKVTLQIWDTAGQEKFKSIVGNYYKDAQCAIVMYDITSDNSFQGAKNWIQEVKGKAPENCFIFLCGSKLDLDDNREVTLQNGHRLSKDEGWLFGETSAKTNISVAEIFTKIAKKYAENLPTEKDILRQTISLENAGGSGKKKKKDGWKC